MLAEKPPADVGSGESGSESVGTKSEMIDYLKASFAYMLRAVALIDDENIPSQPRRSHPGQKVPPLASAWRLKTASTPGITMASSRYICG